MSTHRCLSLPVTYREVGFVYSFQRPRPCARTLAERFARVAAEIAGRLEVVLRQKVVLQLEAEIRGVDVVR
jgi:hypothetical protein